MRIIAGELKGREVRLPRGSPVRPATGLVREQVMNLLTAPRLKAGKFLDLCAGSGLIGFEALSRGAPAVIFVEADKATARNISETARTLGVSDRITVIKRDARRCFAAVRKRLDPGERIAAAILDPPYIPGMAEEILLSLGAAADIYVKDALIVVRTPEELPAAVDGLAFDSRRGAGNASLWLYRPQAGWR
ncbi:RsmD family RNA methyltransferase [bacterium]|nr:RsmD family RNA methyltransferase [bacterium]